MNAKAVELQPERLESLGDQSNCFISCCVGWAKGIDCQASTREERSRDLMGTNLLDGLGH